MQNEGVPGELRAQAQRREVGELEKARRRLAISRIDQPLVIILRAFFESHPNLEASHLRDCLKLRRCYVGTHRAPPLESCSIFARAAATHSLAYRSIGGTKGGKSKQASTSHFSA